MSFFKQFFNFYINASIHVALAVYSLTRITEFYFKLPYNEMLDYFIFFGTISGYNFIKYAGIAKLHHLSLTDNLKIIQIFSLVCFALACYYGWMLPLKTILFFIPFGLLTIFYAVPFLGGFKKNLRHIGTAKIVIIAIVWAGATVILPIIDASKELDANVIIYFVQRFLVVIVLVLPFDIRDLKYDETTLKTIPQKLGLRKTKKFGLILLIFTLIIEFLYSPMLIAKNSFIIFFFMLIILLMRAKKEQSRYYSSFFVEATPTFWWIILLVLNH